MEGTQATLLAHRYRLDGMGVGGAGDMGRMEAVVHTRIAQIQAPNPALEGSVALEPGSKRRTLTTSSGY